jgi:hypothetical protein
MDHFAKCDFKLIQVDTVFSVPSVLETFGYMQQGKHISKIVLKMRESTGKLLAEDVNNTKSVSTEFDAAASYLLISGLGSLGRAMSV